MSTNDPNAELRASVTVNPDTGVTVTTTGVTLYPGRLDVRIPQGRTWNLYATWIKDGAVVDTSAYTAQFVVRTVQGGSALVNLTNGSGITMGTAYVTVAQGTAATSALAFTRGWYNFNVTTGGTTFPLLEGFADLEKSVMA